jgi:hypothetical protein
MKGLLAIFAAFVIAGLAEGVFLDAHDDSGFPWSHIYGFFAFYGFLGSLAIIVVAKYVLAPWLQRPEDYYVKWPSA